MLKARKENDQRKKDEVAALFTPIDIIQAKIPFGVGTSLHFTHLSSSFSNRRRTRQNIPSLCSPALVPSPLLWIRTLASHSTDTMCCLADAKTVLCAFFKAGRCQKGQSFVCADLVQPLT